MRSSAIKRAATLRELADLGCGQTQMAKLTGVCRSRVSQLCTQFGIETKRRPGRQVLDITIRRKFALMEMAELGRSQIQAAILLDIDAARVSQLCKQFSIKMRNAKTEQVGWLKALVLRDFGKSGLTTAAMVERYGCHPKSVAVTIHRLRKEGKLPPVQQRC